MKTANYLHPAASSKQSQQQQQQQQQQQASQRPHNDEKRTHSEIVKQIQQQQQQVSQRPHNEEKRTHSEIAAQQSSPPVQSWLETFGDEEENSLLDYFLFNGEQVEGGSTPNNTADSTFSNSQDRQGVGGGAGHSTSSTSYPAYSSAQHQSQFSTVSSSNAPLSHFLNQVQSSHPSDFQPTPATPAVQFYAKTSELQQVLPPAMQNAQAQTSHPKSSLQQAYMNYAAPPQHPASTSSSSSSLSHQGMGSTPILHVHQQFQGPGPAYNTTNMSPISPAVMCTNEVLMLPSARRYSTSNYGATGNDPNANFTTTQQQWHNLPPGTNDNVNTYGPASTAASLGNAPMQLPIWLQHMNNVAMIANNSQKEGSMAAPAPVSKCQNQTILPNLNTFNQQRFQSQGMHVFPGTDILPIPQSITHMQHHMTFKDDHAMESKEKRDKRLARNRESARQSRRRKKELLLNLRGKVNNRHEEIEIERRNKLECMEHELVADRIRILSAIFAEQSYNGQSVATSEKLIRTVRQCGPNIVERKTAIRFQYNALRRAILPHYSHAILSIALRDSSFLTEAKEERTKIQIQKPSGRVGSKLVGEELSKQHFEDVKDNGSGNTTLTCNSDDKAAFWPLLCYELSIGIDQEEKILQVFEEVRRNPQTQQTRAQILAATTIIASIKESLLAHSISVANQNEIALLQVLTPSQSSRFLEWHLRNKAKCARLLCCKGDESKGQSELGLPNSGSEHSLSDFCKQLTETMKIKKTDA